MIKFYVCVNLSSNTGRQEKNIANSCSHNGCIVAEYKAF